MKFQKPRMISIKTLLQVGNIGLLIVALTLIFVLGFGTATQNTLALQAEKARSLANAARLHIYFETAPIEEQASWIAAGFAEGSLSLERPVELVDILSGTGAGTPNLGFMAVVDDFGQGLGLDFDSGDVVQEVDWSQDEDVLEVLSQSAHWASGQWLEPYWVREMAGGSVIYATPLRREGVFLGMLIQAKSVRGVSERLASLGDGYSYVPYVLYGDYQVIAHKALADLPVVGTENAPLPLIREIGDPILAGRISQQPIGARLPGLGDEYSIGRTRFEDVEYAYLETRVEGFADKPLTVGLYFDERLQIEAVRELIESIFVALIVFILAVIVVFIISRRTANPIVELAEASRQISANKLEEFKPLRHSRLREIDDAFQAFNGMIEGLKERTHIRELFGRMVPEKVAERLINDPDGLAPQSTIATVLFCDIERFTAISEKIQPGEIVGLLNAYFSDMVDVIEANDGIITQFQGDAILAVFNVPVADPDHAVKAIRAAQEMQRRLHQKRYAGLELRNRIGINTGPLVAGNVGAAKRMNYTVHGDAVNTAARLEQMNKEYGTRILISDETRKQAGLDQLKFVAETQLRGREGLVSLFTIDY
ncbi:adenylate/guanylate cyclase domain-containing protein [Aestuariispira insulae]|uniref:Class 3 adenylate cyclase n=1 Tax=Aestuariispira insulae TaxID=1461337 RepID=A0A3D9HWA3_9PROT|nr:adenylate/guanylate cyclase domain-containing protein [Aestuariispira insulae]RED53793.1 class 3 adenylate cyclase [Aestuariispira insulae]